MFELLVVLLVLAAAGGGFAYALASRSKAGYRASNQLVPGVPTRAPASWAGSHRPEAKLHRRLRDALAALRANQRFDDDGSLLDLRVDIEQQAVAIDERLLAVAALPDSVRQAPLMRLHGEVTLVEQAVADLVTKASVAGRAELEATLERMRERIALVDEARATLDAQQLDLHAPLPDPAASPTPPAEEPAPQEQPEPGSGEQAGGPTTA